MSIDKSISDLIEALNRNTAALEKAAGSVSAGASTEKTSTTKKTADKAEKKDDPKITQEQVNAALLKLKDDFGMEHAKPIVKEIGKADKMNEIKPAQYQAVYDAAVAKHAELSRGDAAGGEDDGL